MKNTIFLIFLTVLVTACNSRIKEKIGLTETAPDEYQVQSTRPLEVPPHYELPAPVTNP